MLVGKPLTKCRSSTQTSKSFQPTQSYSVCPHPLHSNDSVLTIYTAFKQTDQEVIDFYARSGSTPIPNVPKFDSRRVVDGQRTITFYKPIPPTSAGKEFELKSRVVGVYDKGKAGSVVETETILAEKGGDVYSKAVGSAFFVGQGNWGGPKGKERYLEKRETES
jgi:hypothetical protein